MACGTFVLVALLCVVIIGCEMPVSVAASDSGICTVKSSEYVAVTQSQKVIVYYTTGTLCWDAWEWFYCEETRSKYETQYSLGAEIRYFDGKQCCNGYQQVTSSPLTCTAFCEHGCYHGNCIAPDHCACDDGWKGSTCDAAICESGCYNGNCIAPDRCTCDDGWKGSTCDTAICESSCYHGNCIAPDRCACDNGWKGSICDTAICESGCYHGKCFAPDRCTCDDGWKGSTCNTAICESSCYHGNCIAPDHCACDDGWKGSICDTAFCKRGCYHGNCIAPDDCACDDGWKGSTCDSAICESGCYQGNCIAPNHCTCDDGWIGSTCDTAICWSGCKHGNCNVPYDCTCHVGWTGGLCDNDVNECKVQNGGCAHECVNTNGSYYCKCASGYNLNDDGHGCQDFPECSTGQAQCSHNCTELPGSYNCSCFDGYSLDKNGYSCNAICESGCYHGDCTTPDNCTCDVGWKGFTCNTALCQPGTYSDSGLEPCEECPPNYYQLNYGSSYCDPCDDYNITASMDEFCVMSTATEEQSSHNTIVGSVVGVIAVIVIVTSILMTTAIACKRYEKKKKTLVHHSERDPETNYYDKVRVKGYSLEDQEKLEMKEPKHDSSICKHSCVRKAPVYYSTIDEKHTSAVVSQHADALQPVLPPATKPPPFERSAQPSVPIAKQPPKPPAKVVSSGTSVFPSFNQPSSKKEYAKVTTSSSFECEGDQTSKTKHHPSPSKVSRPVYENKGSSARSSKLTSHKEPIVPPKPLPEKPQKPTSSLSSRQQLKTPSISKHLVYQNRGCKANSSQNVSKNEITLKQAPSELPPKPKPELTSVPPARSSSSLKKASIYQNKGANPPSKTLVSIQQTATASKPHSELGQNPLPTVPSAQLQRTKRMFLRMDGKETSEELPKIPDKQDLKDRNFTKKLSSSFVSPVYYSSVKELHSSALNSQNPSLLQKPKLPPKPLHKGQPRMLNRLQPNEGSPECLLSSKADEVEQHNQTATRGTRNSFMNSETLKGKEPSEKPNFTRKTSSFESPAYNSSITETHSNNSNEVEPTQQAMFSRSESLAQKPPTVPPRQLLNTKLYGVSLKSSLSATSSGINQQHQLSSTASSSSVVGLRIQQKKISKESTCPKKCSSVFESPVYYRSPGEADLGAPNPMTQNTLPKPNLLPKPPHGVLQKELLKLQSSGPSPVASVSSSAVRTEHHNKTAATLPNCSLHNSNTVDKMVSNYTDSTSEPSSAFESCLYQKGSACNPQSLALNPEKGKDILQQPVLLPKLAPKPSQGRLSKISSSGCSPGPLVLSASDNNHPADRNNCHSIEGAGILEREGLEGTNSCKKLSTHFESPLYNGTAGNFQVSSLIHHKQFMHSSSKPKLLPKPILSNASSPTSNSSSSSSPSNPDQSHPCVQISSSSLWNGEIQGKKDRKVSDCTRKCSSAFDSPVYRSSTGDIHSSALISHKMSATPKPKPRFLPKPASDAPPKQVQKMPSNTFAPDHSMSPCTSKTNQQDRISNATSKSLESYEQMEQKDSRSKDSTTKLSSCFHSPIYNRSASEPSCKQDIVSKSKPVALPNQKYDAVLTQLPNGSSSAHATKLSFSQSACQNGQKDEVNNNHGSFDSVASKQEKNKKMYGKPSSQPVTSFESSLYKRAGEESPSCENAACQLTVPQRKKAEIPPQTKLTPPPRKLSSTLAEALPPMSSPVSSLANQNHEQDPHMVVETYDHLFCFSFSHNQQVPSSKRDDYPNAGYNSHEYDDIDSQTNQGEKFHSSASNAHQVTLPERQKPKLAPKPTPNSWAETFPSSSSPATQKQTQDPHLPVEVYDQPFPFSTTHNPRTPPTKEKEHPSFVPVPQDTGKQAYAGWVD